MLHIHVVGTFTTVQLLPHCLVIKDFSWDHLAPTGNLHYSTQCGGYDSGTFTLTISTPDGTLTCRATITGCRSSSGSCTE